MLALLLNPLKVMVLSRPGANLIVARFLALDSYDSNDESSEGNNRYVEEGVAFEVYWFCCWYFSLAFEQRQDYKKSFS